MKQALCSILPESGVPKKLFMLKKLFELKLKSTYFLLRMV